MRQLLGCYIVLHLWKCYKDQSLKLQSRACMLQLVLHCWMLHFLVLLAPLIFSLSVKYFNCISRINGINRSFLYNLWNKLFVTRMWGSKWSCYVNSAQLAKIYRLQITFHLIFFRKDTIHTVYTSSELSVKIRDNIYYSISLVLYYTDRINYTTNVQFKQLVSS